MTAVDSKTFDILDPGMPVQFCLECDCTKFTQEEEQE
jgi:hypothetical protein